MLVQSSHTMAGYVAPSGPFLDQVIGGNIPLLIFQSIILVQKEWNARTSFGQLVCSLDVAINTYMARYTTEMMYKNASCQAC